MGCTFCQKRCAYKEEALQILEKKRLVASKVAAKWRSAQYRPEALYGFVSCGLMKEVLKDNIFLELCVLGQILEAAKELKDGHKQKVLADYLEYKLQRDKRRN